MGTYHESKGFVVTTDATSEPLIKAEVKLHLRRDSDFTADDDLLDILIKTARQRVEEFTNQACLQKTITEKWDDFPPFSGLTPESMLKLSVSPLSSVTSVVYLDTDGNSQTWASSNYVVDSTSKPPLIAAAKDVTWPEVYEQVNSVTVTYVAGNATTTALPAPFRTAMLLTIAHWYWNPEDSVRRLPTQAEWLLAPFRVFTF